MIKRRRLPGGITMTPGAIMIIIIADMIGIGHAAKVGLVTTITLS